LQQIFTDGLSRYCPCSLNQIICYRQVELVRCGKIGVARLSREKCLK